MFSDLINAIGSIAAAVSASGKGRCEGLDITIDGACGKPLDELDVAGDPPDEVVVLGPDKVRILRGKKLKISLEGDEDAKAELRFKLDNGKLTITRDHLVSGGTSRAATVVLTLPAPRKLVMAGSGRIDAKELCGEEVSIVIAGSGSVAAPTIEAGKLKIDIAGSGEVSGAGKARALRINIAGSGDAGLAGLRCDEARVSVAGSGSCHFVSDGEVKATIMGSGDVTVTGRAKCTVQAMGSGKLVCEPPQDDRKAA